MKLIMESIERKKIVGIIGGHKSNTNVSAIKLAELTGEELAKKGITIACGGEDGIMEAVCRGAKKYGGVTIAITKSNKKEDANPYVDYVIPTSLDLAFMNVLAWSSDAVIAFDGRFGTLCEIGLTLDIGRPLVLLGDHKLINSEYINEKNFIHLKRYTKDSVMEGISFILKKIN